MANKHIKGLTIEIGGDTTNLGKALDAVNKKSRDLSGELADINRLLKMDPGNAEALAQKQKVLAEAVKETAEKLELLREAEKQVQRQFEKGEASEEQVRALQREIIATTKKLDNYKKAAQQTADEVQNLGKESDEVVEDLKDTKKGADKAADGLDDLAESADNAGEATGGLGEKLGSLAKGGLAALATGVTAAVGAMVASAEATREYRTEMGKLEAAFSSSNHSAETATAAYKTLQGVIGETDQSVEAAQQIALLANSEQEVAKWADLAAGVVGRFGDALQPETFFEAANETLKLNEATGAYTQMLEGTGYNVEQFNEGLQACKTEQEKQAYMLEITQQLLGEAGDKYREVNEEVIRANQANEEWMETMGEVGAVIEPILTDVKLLGASLLSDFMPGIQGVAEAFRGMLNGDEGAAADLGTAISDIFTQLLTKLTEMAPQVVEMGISLIGSLASSMLQAVPQLLTTAGQIIVNLVNGLQQNLPLVLAKGAELLANLGEGIRQGLPGLVDRALDVIMNFATTIYDNAPKLIEMGFNLLSNLVQGILDSLPTLLSKAPEIISKFANVINDNFPTILKKGAELVLQIIKGILQAIPELVRNIPKIITAIVDVWEAFNWLSLGKKAFTAVKNGISSMLGSVKAAGQNIANGITNIFKNLPTQLANFGRNAMSGLGNAIRGALGSMKSAASNIFNAVVSGLSGLPSKLLGIGQDLVRGLWNGISDMSGWIVSKIQGFGDSVLSGIKSFFGIKSPSRVFRDEVGAMLAEGMAVGIEQNASIPLKAMQQLSGDMLDEAGSLNGLTLERQLNHTFAAQPQASMMDSGLLPKLDKILAAIEKGQVLMLNGKQLVGGTAKDIDGALGNRRTLAVRGAL